MNWFGKRSQKRLVTKTEERDFERECKNIEHLEDASKKINKDSKKIVSAINAQSRSCSKIGTDLINDLGEDASDNLKEFELAMNKQAMLAADKANMVQHSLMGPTKEYCTIFPTCWTHVKARDKALQEYGKAQVKLEKYEEKEHTAVNDINIARAKKELQPVKEDFEKKSAILMKEMPQLYNFRLAYVQPSLEAFISTQCWCYHETLKTLDRCANEINADNSEDEAANINQILDQIKLLSITSED